ncbi:MAG: hypothetical protein IT531_03805 [Burkholderiales bacterium]|nr:hypothetical protein [Burkholderiales bacterium]
MTSALADPPAAPVFNEEMTKQSAIYQSRGAEVPKGYVIGRTLEAYARALPAEFNDELAKLGAADRWLDIGAGEGRAVLDYALDDEPPANAPAIARKARARAVAISIEDRRTEQWHRTAANLETNQIRYLFGKTFGQYTFEELGNFRVITDVLGGFSYTNNLSTFMEKALRLLEVNGTFYSLLQDVRNEAGNNRPHYPDARFLTEITRIDGSEVRMCAWLKSIGCVEVMCEAKPTWTPPIEVYRVRKVCEDVTVPKLTLQHFQSGTPPERAFRLSPAPAPSSAVQLSTQR